MDLHLEHDMAGFLGVLMKRLDNFIIELTWNLLAQIQRQHQPKLKHFWQTN